MSSETRRRITWMIWIAAITVALFAAGCATPLPSPIAAPVSHAFAPDQRTPLSHAIAADVAAHPGQSGFHLLSSGTEALIMRIALVEAARRSIDLQYYSARNDATGQLLLEALRRAAARGVRVRLLVDDLNLKHPDPTLSALATEPNFLVRVFNPVGPGTLGSLGRLVNLAARFDHLTRRMHNKAIIADNTFAIVGGRNLGDEYFDADPTVNFRDLDVLAAGPIVPRISSSFDRYWNSSESYPIATLEPPPQPAATARICAALHAHWQQMIHEHPALEPRQVALDRQLARGAVTLIWANAEFDADSPSKIDDTGNTPDSRPGARLLQLVQGAQHEFLAISPYFVPRRKGVELLSRLVARGVHVSVLTNSLASTDVVPVHAGYAPYRIPLLEAGVQLYEFKPVRGKRRTLLGGASRASLHAKAYVIDRRDVIIGSFNLDPRSVWLNTELVLVIHSPQIAGRLAQMFDRAISPKSSYHVVLANVPPISEDPARSGHAPGPRLAWLTEEDGQPHRYDVDPDAGLWRNAVTGFFGLLPYEGQL